MCAFVAYRLCTLYNWRTVIVITTGRERRPCVVPRAVEALANVTSLFESGADGCIGRQLALFARVALQSFSLADLVTSLTIAPFDPFCWCCTRGADGCLDLVVTSTSIGQAHGLPNGVSSRLRVPSLRKSHRGGIGLGERNDTLFMVPHAQHIASLCGDALSLRDSERHYANVGVGDDVLSHQGPRTPGATPHLQSHAVGAARLELPLRDLAVRQDPGGEH